MTDPDMSHDTQEPSMYAGFDYCFWSKLLVAIVLFPLIAAISVFLFSNIVLKITVGAIAIGSIVSAAIKIDQMPCFAGKIPAVVGKAKR